LRTLVQLPHSTVVAEVDVYRDGAAVVVMGKGSFEKDTPDGKIQTAIQGVSRFETIEAFEATRNKAKAELAKRLKGAPAAYVKLCSKFDLDRDVREAPQLPPAMKAVMPRLLAAGGGGG
jgi:hypothetical protein